MAGLALVAELMGCLLACLPCLRRERRRAEVGWRLRQGRPPIAREPATRERKVSGAGQELGTGRPLQGWMGKMGPSMLVALHATIHISAPHAHHHQPAASRIRPG